MLRARLKNWLSWQPTPAELLGLMRPVRPWPVQMERYQPGIDNAHTDVYLSPRFVLRASLLVRILVRHEVASTCWGETDGQPRPEDLDDFRDAYRGVVEGALRQPNDVAPVDWVRLAQLSLLKVLLSLVPQEVQEMRRQLEIARDDTKALASGRRLQYHERLVILAREEHGIAYRVLRRLFELIYKVEVTQLRKLRKSRLGNSWPLPRDALFNPLLHLPKLLGQSEVMHHYPIHCVEGDSIRYLEGLNRCITSVFRDYLPDWANRPPATDEGNGNEAGGGIRVTDRLDQGGLRGFVETEIVLRRFLAEEEYKRPLVSWLDEPDNLAQLLDQGRHLGAPGEPGYDENLRKQWRQYKEVVRDELYQGVESLNVMPWIAACYQAPRIYRELRGSVPSRAIYEFLTGRQDARKVLRRFGASHGELDPAYVTRTLENASTAIRQLNRAKRREYAEQILVDFLRLRRDIKLAYKTFEAMDRIRLLDSDEDVNLSRANGLLYEFRMADEQSLERRIRTHVILKADLRGSTRITAELRARRLNPATHFSQNFFNPINACLNDFGAHKVFVEGDAVILSFLEHDGDAERGLSVAHACGMAGRILEVVSRQNALNRRHGLPELELGVGIAHCDEEPTFLYDGDREIMISPAINLADRLSSCAALLRQADLGREGGHFRVEVLLPETGAEPVAEVKTDLLRYNVNGVEMDASAFAKLRTELALHRVDVKVRGRPERFHVGRYPDRSGRLNWLVVREAPVRVWSNGRGTETKSPDRRFFEVVTEPGLVTRIRARLKAGRSDSSRLVPMAAERP